MDDEARRKYLRETGITYIKKSGAACINWKKAVKSHLLKEQIEAMRRIANRRSSS